MSNELHDRVSKLEFRADATDKQLETLEATGETLKKSLDGVQATLLQLKWLGYGALGMFVVNQFGLLHAIKLFLGLHGE